MIKRLYVILSALLRAQLSFFHDETLIQLSLIIHSDSWFIQSDTYSWLLTDSKLHFWWSPRGSLWPKTLWKLQGSNWLLEFRTVHNGARGAPIGYLHYQIIWVIFWSVCLFLLFNSPKPRKIQFITQDKERQQFTAYKKLESVEFWHLSWKT